MTDLLAPWLLTLTVSLSAPQSTLATALALDPLPGPVSGWVKLVTVHNPSGVEIYAILPIIMDEPQRYFHVSH